MRHCAILLVFMFKLKFRYLFRFFYFTPLLSYSIFYRLLDCGWPVCNRYFRHLFYWSEKKASECMTRHPEIALCHPRHVNPGRRNSPNRRENGYLLRTERSILKNQRQLQLRRAEERLSKLQNAQLTWYVSSSCPTA